MHMFSVRHLCRQGLVLLFACTMSFSSLAQQSEAQASLKKILGELTSYKADFVQKIVDAQGEVLQQSEGKIWLNKPKQLRWEVSKPDESLFVADGEVIFNVDHFVEQVSLIDQESIVDNNPLMLLISDDESAWQGITVSQAGTDYVLDSKDVNTNIVQLRLSFENKVLAALVSVDRQQQRNEITFLNRVLNPEIPQNTFVPNYPNSYLIDDQRKANP
ncbi:outer membrane lipoprotein chaperone LolA [Glaciecola siphonariae]|uniref:Outer-membrane lipoprotein carrier protein n=1 Tax=Glaciecola siphonariae TaxID=521012 RepID=A0ABV9LV64_9ALTE